MTAIIHDRYGGAPEAVLRLDEVDKPSIGDDEVLVRVRAASVDRGTWHTMAGLPYPIRLAGFGLRRPKHLNPGRSLAGTVEAVGKDVTGFAPGDEVFGICDGSFAAYARVRTDKLARKPANLSFDHAAAVPISGLTALQGVRDHGRIQAGQQVLIVSASGGVGSFAVQIAKGVRSRRHRCVRHREGGSGPGPRRRPRHRLHPRRLRRRRTPLRRDSRHWRQPSVVPPPTRAHPQARLVIVGGETDGRWLGGTDRQLRAHLLSPFVGQKLGTFVSSENADDLTALCELIEAGKVKPVIDRSFPLHDLATAIRHLVNGHARGKIVITVHDPDRMS